MTTNFDMIGRDEIDDLEAILSITNSDVDEVVHTVRAEADALFTWDYERSRPALVKLYEKAKTSQWNAETDLDWSIEVDQAAVVLANQAQMGSAFAETVDLKGTVFETWKEDDWIQLGIESQNWSLSQFMHGEQGALICTAQLEMLLDDIISDSRWDMTYLGMQIMVEGLALAAFCFMHQMTTEPLLKK